MESYWTPLSFLKSFLISFLLLSSSAKSPILDCKWLFQCARISLAAELWTLILNIAAYESKSALCVSHLLRFMNDHSASGAKLYSLILHLNSCSQSQMTSLLLSLASMVYRQGELTELWVIKMFQELRIIEKNNTVCIVRKRPASFLTRITAVSVKWHLSAVIQWPEPA